MNGSTTTVLLIDDDSFSRIMLRTLLQKVGYQVIEANDGNEGIELFKEVSPALVLLDAKMPGMDGFDCCRKIRDLPGGEHVPILMVTGLDDIQSVNNAFESGATDYITKPVQMPVLVGRMRHLMQTVKAEQSLRESEEQYRSLITSLQEVIFQLNAAGELLFINPVWHKLMGYGLKGSLGKPFEDFLHPAERQRHSMQFSKAWKQPSQCYRYRSRCLTETGMVRWVEIQLCANVDGRGVVLDIAGRLVDITDRTVREQYRVLEYAITRVLSNANDSSIAVRRALQAICGSLGFQLGEFWLLDAHTEEIRCHERWYLKTEKLKEFSDYTDTLTLTTEEGIPKQVWESEKALWIGDIAQDGVFSRKEAAEAAGLRALLIFPVRHGAEKLGGIALFSQEVSPPDKDLLRMLTIFGRQLGQYLKRKQSEEELQNCHQLLQLELQRAAQYVEALLPNTYTEVSAGCKAQDSVWVNTQYQPSSTLGGDAFDYDWLDDENLMFYLFDVAGHGVKSALLSVSILNILRKRTLKGANFYQPETVLEALNEVFQVNEKGEDYFTCWYGVYNAVNRKLTFASAGHPPGVLVTPSHNTYKTSYLDSDGIAVGLLPDFPFDVRQHKIPPGSSLYIFSDGVYEIPVGKNNAIWGLEAWTDLLQQHKVSQSDTLKPLLDKVRSINGGDILEDDFSVLEVNFS
ncbi:MAG: SpoIIE family protein phosphatase [Leptolyngbyaceae cyanobacterium MO_188.B28]|nr:SpoIIE family protein phosphatase [Leptolyngbyaceae cyanobacterium MO_188.B28]